MLQQKELSSESISEPRFWKNIIPNLSIAGHIPPLISILPNQEELLYQLNLLSYDGYFHFDSLLPEYVLSPLRETIYTLSRHHIHPVFAFIFDEFWSVIRMLSGLLTAALGEGFLLTPDFWAQYVDIADEKGGLNMHRDRGAINTVRHEDGMPEMLTLWIPLTDATPLNSCMYILPGSKDPNYPHKCLVGDEINDLRNIRALPAKAGSVLAWNGNVVHWGSKSSRFATHPRINIGFGAIRKGVCSPSTPLLEALSIPSFKDRLKLIGRQIILFSYMYHLPDRLVDIAYGLAGEEGRTLRPHGRPMQGK